MANLTALGFSAVLLAVPAGSETPAYLGIPVLDRCLNCRISEYGMWDNLTNQELVKISNSLENIANALPSDDPNIPLIWYLAKSALLKKESGVRAFPLETQ